MGVGLLCLLAVGYTWATWRFFTLRVPGGNDFLAHYTAWQAYLEQGVSPYSDEAALHTQMAIYGRPARPGEDQNRLTYPFYSGLVHAPFVALDYPLARALYMVLLQAALLGGVIMALDLFRWRPSAWMLGLLLVWSLLFYPHARGIILGQFAIWGFFSLCGALYLLRRRRDGWAGALLTLATVKPTLVFLALPFLLAWAVARRRWRFVTGFLGLLAVLALGGLIVLPTWIGEWIYRMGRYRAYTVGQSPVWLLTHRAWPTLGSAGEIVIAALLLVGMLVAWWRALRPEGERRFHWTLGLTLVVSNLIVPRSATTNYVILLVTALWLLAALARASDWGKATLLAVLPISLAGLWWLHFATVVGNAEQPIMFVPYPLALGLALVLGKNWLLRDAQTAGVLP
jgi:hypothetical protein